VFVSTAHAIKSVPLEYAHVQEDRAYDFISMGISNHKIIVHTKSNIAGVH
jgi:hypothetical protein